MPSRDVAGLHITYLPAGRGPGELHVQRDGEILLVERVTLSSAPRRMEIVRKLPESDREVVEKALREMAAEVGIAAASPSSAAALQASAREIVHGTFDLRPALLLYGFRVERVTDDGALAEVTVRVLSERTDTGYCELRVLEGDEFTAGGREYVLDPRWRPPLLSERWSREGILGLVSGEANPASPPEVYRGVKQIIGRYLDFVDAGAMPVLAAFTVLTYVARAFPAVPYIGLLGPKGTGKSQALATVERLAFNPFKGRVTAAALGDTTSALRGTVLVDQAHRLPEELLDLLVDGYRREGGRRRVVDMDRRGRPHEFETFGPKMFASADGMDPDLLDRLFVIRTAPAARPVLPLPASEAEFASLRGQLYSMALGFWPLFSDAAASVESEAVSSRAEELWAPVEAILRVCKAGDADMKAARALYRRSVTETVAELGAWELALLDELATRVRSLEGAAAILEMSNEDLLAAVLKRLDLPEGGPRPGERWLGRQLSNLNLLEDKDRRQTQGRRVRVYTFTRGRVEGQLRRFGLLGPAPRAEFAAQPARPSRDRSGSMGHTPRLDSHDAARLPDALAGRSLGRVCHEQVGVDTLRDAAALDEDLDRALGGGP